MANDWIRDSTVQQLKRWLFRAFRENDYTPLDILPSRDADGQIRAYFDAWPLDEQEKFKNALAVAIAEWRMPAHGCTVLNELLHLAALIRASNVVPTIGALHRRVFMNVEQTEEVFDTMDTAAAVVAGFAGLPAADALMEQWFFDDEFAPELLALPLIGLSLGHPSEYPRFLPRFLQFARNRPDAYDLGYVLDAVLDFVTAATFAQELAKLDTTALINLNAVLASIDDPPVKILMQGNGCHVIDLRRSPSVLHTVPLRTKELERFYQALVIPNRSIYALLDQTHIPIRKERLATREERRGERRPWLNP